MSATTLATARQLAERHNVHRTTIYDWAKRYDDFPAPVVPEPGERWDAEEVAEWVERTAPTRRPGRPPR